MNWLFLKVISSLYYSNFLNVFLLVFFPSSTYGGFPPLYSPLQSISIVHLFIIQPRTQVSVLLSNFSSFLWAVVVENTIQRSSSHWCGQESCIVHLMRWQQLFPKIFPCSYPFFAHLKSIFVVGLSWKVTQVKPKFTLLTFVRSEEDNSLGLVPSNISLHDHLLWGLSKHFLLLGRTLASKWGLGPNMKVRVFVSNNYYHFLALNILYFLKL